MTDIEFKTLADLNMIAKIAGVFDTPEYQNDLNMIILLDNDPLYIQFCISKYAPLALQKLSSPQVFDTPDPYEIDGLLPIGYAPENEDIIFGMNPNELSMHTFITGSSGTGKSVIIQLLLEGLRRYNRKQKKGIHSWIIDFMVDNRHTLRLLEKGDDLLVFRPKDFRLNPLQPPPGVLPEVWLQIVCDTFASSTGIFHGGKDILIELVQSLYMEFGVYDGSDDYPTMTNLLALALHYKKNAGKIKLGSRKKDSLETLIGRLKTIQISLVPMINCKKGYDLLELAEKDMVLELQGITNYVQNFLINLLLQWIYNHRKVNNIRRKIPDILFIFDEAKRIFDANFERRPMEPTPTIVSLVDEIRQFGIGLVVSDQEPSKILKSLKANTYTKIALQVREGSDINDMAVSMSLTDEQKSAIGALPKWTAIVKKGPIKPFLCKMPLLEPEEKDVSNAELDNVMKPKIKKLHWQELTAQDLDDDVEKYNNIIENDDSLEFYIKRGLSTETTPGNSLEEKTDNLVKEAEKVESEKSEKKEKLSDDLEKLLQSIIDTPFMAASERYKTNNINSARGSKLHRTLQEKGYVKPVKIKRGKGRKPALYYSANESAYKYFGSSLPKEVADSTRGHFQHQFWQNMVMLHLQLRRLNPYMEYYQKPKGSQKKGKRADVGCHINDELVAFEIGTSDARNEIENIKKDLGAGFDKVVVICIEEIYENLLRRVKTELDEAIQRIRIDCESEANHNLIL